MTNDVSSPPPGLEDYGLERADHPVFVWDGDVAGFAWANAAGLQHWGALNLSAFRAAHLDRAMPAVVRLHALARSALPSEGIYQTLMFWTPRGARRLDCLCRPIDLGDGGHGLILEANTVPREADAVVAGPVPYVDRPPLNQSGPEPRGRTAHLANSRMTDGHGARLQRANGTNVPGFFNGSERTNEEPELPTPTSDDRVAMAEIARMLGRPGEQTGDSVHAAPCGSPAVPSVFIPATNVTAEVDTGAQLRGDAAPPVTDSPQSMPIDRRAPATEQSESADNSPAAFDTLNHELRTPLNSIIGFAEMMKAEQLGPIENPRYREYIGDILDSAHHALSLINDLLEASRVRAGHLDMNRSAVDVPNLLDRAIAAMQPQAQSGDVVLVAGYPNVLATVLADERALRQIMLNILSNAIKFTGAAGRVFVTAKSDSVGAMTIVVRDTGRGMSPEQLEQAMQPWEQVGEAELQMDDNGGGATQPGSGLGLPLVKALTEAQGGTLAITSTPGEGTRVAITLPTDMRDDLAASSDDTSQSR